MKSTFTRIGIIGASGYTGAELVRLLDSHQHAKVTLATASGERAGVPISELFPSLRDASDIICEEYNLERIVEQCDFVFVALPHGKAMEYVPDLLKAGLKICDLGADFRLRDAAVFEEWYKHSHSAVDYLNQAVYGLPEWNREQIRSASLVANPGCYPTSAILPLAPLLAADLIEDENIIVDSASGTSGAGRSSFSLGFHFSEVIGDYKAYNVGGHRHTPEIEQGLGDATGKSTFPTIIFTPHLLPIARGILSTSYAKLKRDITNEEVYEVLSQKYADEPFVRVLKPGQLPQVKHVVGSNFCDIGTVVNARSGKLIAIGAIDNLLKGASGQAVQNMNIMCGFEETEGLKQAPLFP